MVLAVSATGMNIKKEDVLKVVSPSDLFVSVAVCLAIVACFCHNPLASWSALKVAFRPIAYIAIGLLFFAFVRLLTVVVGCLVTKIPFDDDLTWSELNVTETRCDDLFDQRLKALTQFDIKPEQYRLHVTSAENIVQRRQTLHGFFVTANGILIASSTGLLKPSSTGVPALDIDTATWLIGFVIAVLSYAWLSLFWQYDRLARAKLQISRAIEKRCGLGITALQQQLMEREQSDRTGFTYREVLLPIIFCVVGTLLSMFGLTLEISARQPDTNTELIFADLLELEGIQKLSTQSRL